MSKKATDHIPSLLEGLDTVETTDSEIQGSVETAKSSNAQALTKLLDLLEETAPTTFEKGFRFERLSIDYFTYDKRFLGRFIKVQPYKDWAKDYPHLATSQRDDGIDLVATNKRDDPNIPQTFTAIQCKFYGLNARTRRKGIDSFCNASDKIYFTGRIIVATNQNWSSYALESLKNKTVPVIVLTRPDLENSSIDWSSYLTKAKRWLKSRGY